MTSFLFLAICPKRPHKSDPKKYEEEITGHGFIIRRCPAGTIFSQTACDCEIDTRPKRKRGRPRYCFREF